MLIYNRYISKNIFFHLLSLSLILTFTLWSTQSVKFIELAINTGFGISNFLYISSLLLPSLITNILPFASFIATISVYNRMVTDSELIILSSSGLSNFDKAKPAIFIGVLFTILSYTLSLFINPIVNAKLKDTISYYKNNYASVLLEEKVFNNILKDVTIYIDNQQENGTMHGVFLYDSRDKKNTVTIIAESAKIVTQHNIPKFIFSNGTSQQINKNGDLEVLQFDNFVHEISITKDENKTRNKKADEYFIKDLLFPKEKLDSFTRNKYFAEAHQRLSWPYYNFLFALLAAYIVVSGEFNRKYQYKKIILGSIYAIAILVIGLFIINLSIKIQNIAYLIYFYLIFISYLILKRLKILTK